MVRSTSKKWNKLVPVVLTLAVLLVPGLALADDMASGVAAEIKAAIMAGNAYNKEHLMDEVGGTSKDGSTEFWSSGGLMQWAAPDASPSQYEHFAITAKHITVIELPGGQAAVAMYYSEGSMQVKGGPAVGHYLTRVTQVFVKEEGKWVVRAAHWSPIAGGSGTSQTSLD